jgi:hypothetical protein
MLTFVQIKASNLGLQGNLQAVQAPSLKALRASRAETSSGKYLHFSTNGLETFLVVAGIIEGLRHPPGIQRLAVNLAF